MNGRPLTDAQITRALRAHLPERAEAGLRERILDAAEATPQQRALPSFFGVLSDADPVARRRSLLVAAALLVALALASAVAVGALRLLERDPFQDLSLEPPADVPAFVLSSYERLPQLPPVALTWHDSGSTKGRIYVDRSGAVRFDQFASADATEPSSYRILSPNHRISGVATVGSDKVWIEPGHEAIGEDPRVFIRTILSGGDWPGCEIERDQSAVDSGGPATGWRYVGLEDVAGRPTHHVACVGDLWIDIETRLILRTQEPAVNDAGQPIPVEFTEVTEIAFGEQPAALFEPPGGVTRMSADAYAAYICARDLPNELVPGISDCPTAEAEPTPLAEPSPTPTPMPTARPNTSDCAVPPGEPSEPIGPLAWSPERLKEDWPAPVRPEPAGGGSVQPMPLQYPDPLGDNGSTALPCVDIRWVMADTEGVRLKLVDHPPVVDPAEMWITYGVVTDEDGDGVPDWRYGIDNMPVDAGDPPNRSWRTNLHTGETDAGPEHGDPNVPNDAGFKSGLPPEGAGVQHDAAFTFGATLETTRGPQGWGFELDMPFYTWASLIVDGQVVATDYAPDAGWLVATRGATPGGTFLLGDPLPNLSMTVPDGWTGEAGHLHYEETLVSFAVIPYPEDPCTDMIEPPLGPSFDDLVSYLPAMPQIDISESTEVTVDGYRGRYLRYTAVDKDFDCSLFPRGPHSEAWILDVDGVHLVIAALSDEAPSETVRAEVRKVVGSIHIER